MTKVSRKSHKNMGNEGKPKYIKREKDMLDTTSFIMVDIFIYREDNVPYQNPIQS